MEHKTFKVCSKCGENKHFTEFFKQSGAVSGLTSACKVCTRKTQKKYAQSKHGKKVHARANKKYNAANKDKHRARHFKNTYGLSVNQHSKIYIDQDGACAICRKPVCLDAIDTDHDHVTGEVRGLLCRNCNIGMRFVDDDKFLKLALGYKHG